MSHKVVMPVAYIPRTPISTTTHSLSMVENDSPPSLPLPNRLPNAKVAMIIPANQIAISRASIARRLLSRIPLVRSRRTERLDSVSHARRRARRQLRLPARSDARARPLASSAISSSRVQFHGRIYSARKVLTNSLRKSSTNSSARTPTLFSRPCMTRLPSVVGLIAPPSKKREYHARDDLAWTSRSRSSRRGRFRNFPLGTDRPPDHPICNAQSSQTRCARSKPSPLRDHRRAALRMDASDRSWRNRLHQRMDAARPTREAADQQERPRQNIGASSCRMWGGRRAASMRPPQ